MTDIEYSIICPKSINKLWKDTVDQLVALIFGDSQLSSWRFYPPLILFAIADLPGLDLPSHSYRTLWGKGTGNNIIGFKVGSFRSPTHYHSSVGGVLPSYRRKGIARQLQNITDQLIEERGVTIYTFNTYPNTFREMFIFGWSNGFEIYHVENTDRGLKIYFRRYTGRDALTIEHDDDFGTGLELQDPLLLLRSDIFITGWKYYEDRIQLLYDVK